VKKSRKQPEGSLRRRPQTKTKTREPTGKVGQEQILRWCLHRWECGGWGDDVGGVGGFHLSPCLFVDGVKGTWWGYEKQTDPAQDKRCRPGGGSAGRKTHVQNPNRKNGTRAGRLIKEMRENLKIL